MKKRTLMTSAIALFTTAGIAVAAGNNVPPREMPPHTHGRHHMHGGEHQGKHSGLPHGFEQLNLTDAQKAKIKTIMEQGRPAQADNQNTRHEDFHQRMQARQAQEQKLMSNQTFDEQAARNMIAERQAERATMEKEHAERELQMLKQRHAVFQVLTPEQQQKLWDNQKQMQERANRHFSGK